VPLLGVARGEVALDRGVFGRGLAVGAQEVAEQQGELLGEAARPADVDVGPRMPGRFPEVPLGALGVAGPVDEAEIWMSITGLAASPGTEVEPMWSMRIATGPSARRSLPPSSVNRSGQPGS
jgi:hypothetical protein